MKTTRNSGTKDTTLSFSRADIKLLADIGFFEKKRQLFEKITSAFGILEGCYYEAALDYQGVIPLNGLTKRGKISRGENYLGLPYLLLDFPAIFQKDSVFAFRTLFWWGHGFSFTFHVSGDFMKPLLAPMGNAINATALNDCLICINENQWEHHFETSNYIPVKDYISASNDFFEDSSKKGFFKITKRLPIGNSETLYTDGVEFIRSILKVAK